MSLEAVEIVKGDLANFLIYVNDRYGRPVDLSDWDLFQVGIPYEGGIMEVSETEGANGVIALSGSALLGTLEVSLTSVATALLNEGRSDMQVKLDNSDTPNPKSNVLQDLISVVAALLPPAP